MCSSERLKNVGEILGSNILDLDLGTLIIHNVRYR